MALSIVALLVWWFSRVREKKEFLIRVVCTLPLIAVFRFVVYPRVTDIQSAGYTAVGAIFILLAIAWIIAIIWVPTLTGLIGNLFGNLLDEYAAPEEPKPFYSIFNSKRNQGKYFEALQEIHRQLDRFPTDFEGQMLLAELQAQNLNDLPGAEITISKLCAQPEQPPSRIAYALNQLADWHLSLTRDREAAQHALERIVELMPLTDLALQASQRIGHLASNEMLLASHDREKINVKKGVENLGLLRGANGRLKAPEVDQEKLAAEYVAHLETHPLDGHTREQLAILYVKHYHRLDLALEQLEQLVQQPGHAAKKVVHWLNVMADLQVIEKASIETIRATLQRILDLYPDIAAADMTRRRIDMIRYELNANKKSADVQLGNYEQNIGLKRSK